MLVADAFVLEEEKTNMFIDIHSDVMAIHRNSFEGWQDMSDVERSTAEAGFKNAKNTLLAKEVLSANQQKKWGAPKELTKKQKTALSV